MSLRRRIRFALCTLALPLASSGAQTVDPRATFYQVDGWDSGVFPTFLDLSGFTDGAKLYLFPRGRFTVGPGGTGYLMDARSNGFQYGFAGAFTSDTWVGPTDQNIRLHTVASTQPDLTLGPSLGGLNRNVPNDFRIFGNVYPVVKPTGANYLAIGVIDDAYWDNSTLAPQFMRVYVASSPTVDPDHGNCDAMSVYGLPCTGGNGPWLGCCGPTGQFPDPNPLPEPYIPEAGTTTPEPSTIALTTLGLFGMGVVGRRRRTAD